MQAAKKVIILDNIPSNRISQAIFILREDAEDAFDAVGEAEKLVYDFLGGKPIHKRKLSHRVSAVILALAVTALCLAAYFAYIF